MKFAIIISPGPAWIPGKPASQQPLGDHGQYLQRLFDERKLLYSGPFTDDLELQRGLIVIEAADEAEAKSIIENDPAHRDQIFQHEPHAWLTFFDQHEGKSLRPKS